MGIKDLSSVDVITDVQIKKYINEIKTSDVYQKSDFSIIDEDKLEELREKIKNGVYFVDFEETAKSILNFIKENKNI